MSFPKFIFIGSLILFCCIGLIGVFKKKSNDPSANSLVVAPVESQETPVINSPVKEEKPAIASQDKVFVVPSPASTTPVDIRDDFPNIDRIFELFTTGPKKLPIVETITYATNVPWLKGRPAWIADYAAHYETSRHFIARSLNGKPNYIDQKVSPGKRFNVFRKDKNFQFYLLVDLSRCKMGFYYIDLATNERVLLKTYSVGLGRLQSRNPSDSLTPIGRFTLGDKIAIYKPGAMGHFQNQKVEMIQIFGTRWLPFGEELESKTAARGYGIHGAPWTYDAQGQLVESRDIIGKYDSDGCIRLSCEDMEELFSIVISKPTVVDVVRDFKGAKLPGVEVASPTR